MTSPEDWRTLTPSGLANLPTTRVEAHYALQLLASFAQNFVPEKDDDSHRSMRWEAGEATFWTETSGHGALNVGLRLSDFTLLVRQSQTPMAQMPLFGERLADARAWIQTVVRGAGVLPVELSWPEYALVPRSGGWQRRLAPDAGALLDLVAWFENGLLVLERMTGDVQEASPIRCWPHHFDMASLLTFRCQDVDQATYIGMGLSPGDAPEGLPYFYVNGWPPPAPDRLPPLEPPARWRTEGWVGAVLSAEDVTRRGEGKEGLATVEAFFQRAGDAMKGALSDRMPTDGPAPTNRS